MKVDAVGAEEPARLTVVVADDTPGVLELMAQVLKTTAEHVVTAVYSSPYPLVPSFHLKFRLDELPAQAENLHVGYTLFVPATHVRPIEDLEVVRLMDDPEHLHRVTR